MNTQNAQSDPEDTVHLKAIARRLTEPWKPIDVVTVNDTIVRMVRLEGTFPWHRHAEDELFLCWRGSFEIEIEGAPSAELHAGDALVVRAGARHRPVAAKGPAHALLIEPPQTKQYGEAAGQS